MIRSADSKTLQVQELPGMGMAMKSNMTQPTWVDWSVSSNSTHSTPKSSLSSARIEVGNSASLLIIPLSSKLTPGHHSRIRFWHLQVLEFGGMAGMPGYVFGLSGAYACV